MNRESFFKAFKNQELFYQVWENETPKNDIVLCITHGIGEHSDSYVHFVKGVLPFVHSIYAFDLRGHGKSEGKRGVASVKDHVEDLRCFHKLVQSQIGNKKLFLLGHSMGGLVLARYLLQENSLKISGAILSSPLMGIRVAVPVIKDLAAKVLNRVFPNVTLFNEVQATELSHDNEIVDTYARDPLRHDQICPRLYLDFLDCFEYFKRNSDKWNYPLLMQLAGDDRIVSRKDSEIFFEALKYENKTKYVYEGFYHEIYNELDRQKVFEDLEQWLKGFL